MNRALPLAVLALLAGFAVPIEASAAERTFSISDFQRIRVIGPFRVDVIADRLTTVRGKGSNDALDRVRLDVQGQTLFVRLDRTNFGGAEDKGPPAVITIRAAGRQDGHWCRWHRHSDVVWEGAQRRDHRSRRRVCEGWRPLRR